MLLADFFKYLFMSVVAGIVMLFIRGWLAQEDWFIQRFGSEEEKRVLHQRRLAVTAGVPQSIPTQTAPNSTNRNGYNSSPLPTPSTQTARPTQKIEKEVEPVAPVVVEPVEEMKPQKVETVEKRKMESSIPLYSQKEIKDFIFLYFYTAMRNKTTPYLNLFSFPIERYFENDNVSMDWLRQKRTSYINEWFNRVYKVTRIDVEEQSRDEVTVKVFYDWDIRSSRRNVRKGTSIILMKLKYEDGRFRVKSIEKS